MPLLIARGGRAFLEYSPMRPFDARESQRVYRRYSYGPLLEVFVLDMRSYRGPNSANLQTTPSAATAFLGQEQLDWLKAGLKKSRAVWKVVAADMPLGLNVGDGVTPTGEPRWEAVANGESGAAKGRELEFAELLSYLKRHRVHKVVWLTATSAIARRTSRSGQSGVPGFRRLLGCCRVRSTPAPLAPTRWTVCSVPSWCFPDSA